MNKIKELEEEIAKLKKEEIFNKWEKYLSKLKDSLNKLIGKTILYYESSTSIYIFKITNIKEQYYIDKEGFYGQWSPRRWLELETTPYLSCRGFDIKKIDSAGFDFKFKKLSKNQLCVSKLDFCDSSLNKSCWAELGNIYKIGYTEYMEYRDDPDYDRALEFLKMRCWIIPDEVYDAAFKIHQDNINATMKFISEFDLSIENKERVVL